MDGPRDFHNKWGESDGDKFHDIPYMCNLKRNDINELIYKTETDSQTQKTNIWLPKEKGGGGND